MRTLSDIITRVNDKVDYPADIVSYHVRRLAVKFDYTPVIKETYTKNDADDIEFISYRFLQDRKRRESLQKPTTALLPKIEPEKNTVNTGPQTKPLPVIKKTVGTWFRHK